ncbi:MAG TPA: HDOD domain-containing protein, partial [Firmicutes bacterium]|nr:HDOD domain-containing protein [Bacillota bacterium]
LGNGVSRKTSGDTIVVPIRIGHAVNGIVGSTRSTGNFACEDELKMLIVATKLGSICEQIINEASHDQKLQSFAHALSAALDARDPNTHGHSHRVAMYAMAILNELGYREADRSSWNMRNRVRVAALLHDIGKVGIPDSILLKEDSLTEEEYERIKRHPIIGTEILNACHGFKDLIPGVLYHHEHFDGSGYPFGLAGEEIPFMARVIALADAFDAITSDRPFQHASSHEEAIAILKGEVKGNFDPVMLEALTRAHEKGTLRYVRLPSISKSIDEKAYDDIDRVYGRHLSSIPSLPHVLSKVRSLLDDPDASLGDVAKVLSTDEGLASRVLRLVNSAYYGLPHMVATIPLATTILGVEAIRNHVVNIAYADLMNSLGQGFEEYDLLWKHALKTATWARALAQKWGNVDCEEAFTAGLIHDVGKALSLRLKAGAYARIIVEAYKSGKPLVGVEEEIVGFDHTRIGAWAAARWKLPELLVNAIAYHHDPTSVSGDENTAHLVRIIHLADIAARAMDSSSLGFIPFVMLELNPVVFRELGSQYLLELEAMKDEIEEQEGKLESTFSEVAVGVGS